MMDWVWDAIIYSVPWWVWATVAVVLLTVLLFWVRAVGGLRNALVIVGGVSLAVAAGIISIKGRQQGALDQQQKDQKNADRTLDRAHSARDRARERDSSPDGLRDDDGFRRDD